MMTFSQKALTELKNATVVGVDITGELLQALGKQQETGAI